MLMLIPAR
jgi:hypothetical protein